MSLLLLLHAVCLSFLQRDERTLVVWADTLDAIVPACHSFEDKLLRLVWRAKATQLNRSLTSGALTTDSRVPATDSVEKFTHVALNKNEGEKDVEEGWTPAPRPIRLYAPVYNGLGAGLSLFFVVSGGVVLLKVSSCRRSFVLEVVTARKLMPKLGMGARWWHDALRPACDLPVLVLYLAFLLNAGQFYIFVQKHVSSTNTNRIAGGNDAFLHSRTGGTVPREQSLL